MIESIFESLKCSLSLADSTCELEGCVGKLGFARDLDLYCYEKLEGKVKKATWTAPIGCPVAGTTMLTSDDIGFPLYEGDS